MFVCRCSYGRKGLCPMHKHCVVGHYDHLPGTFQVYQQCPFVKSITNGAKTEFKLTVTDDDCEVVSDHSVMSDEDFAAAIASAANEKPTDKRSGHNATKCRVMRFS